MSNKTKLDSNKSKSFGILIAIVAASLIIITSLGITLAWFSNSYQMIKNSDTPSIAVGLVNAGNTAVAQETVATNVDNLESQIKVAITSNVSVYVRVKINAFCFDSTGIRTDLDVTDYYTITINTTSWSTISGYDTNFLYYKDASTGDIKLAANGDKLLAVSTNRTGKLDLPTGVSLKLQVFAEAVQGNNTGLSKWAV